MKYFRNDNPYFIYLLCIILLIGCNSKTKKELIVGKWKIKEFSNRSVQIPYVLQEKINKGINIEFKKDGKYTLTGFDDKIQTGNYTINEIGILNIMLENGTSQADTIYELTESKLVFVDPNGSKYTSTK